MPLIRAKVLCQQCGLCCKELHFRVAIEKTDEATEAEKFYAARGLKTGYKHGGLHVIVPHTCPHYSNTDGCLIYPTRPMSCRLYNGLRDPLIKDRCALRELLHDKAGQAAADNPKG